MFFKILHSPVFSKEGKQVDFIPDQVYNMESNYAYNKVPQGGKMNRAIQLPKFELVKESIKTDLLFVQGVNTFYFIVSDKAFECIRNLNLPKIKVLQLEVYENAKLLNFNAIHFED